MDPFYNLLSCRFIAAKADIATNYLTFALWKHLVLWPLWFNYYWYIINYYRFILNYKRGRLYRLIIVFFNSLECFTLPCILRKIGEDVIKIILFELSNFSDPSNCSSTV